MLLKAAAPRCARTLGDALALVMLAKEPCDTVYLPGSLVIVEAGGSGIRLTREAAQCDGRSVNAPVLCGRSNFSYVPGPGVLAVISELCIRFACRWLWAKRIAGLERFRSLTALAETGRLAETGGIAGVTTAAAGLSRRRRSRFGNAILRHCLA